MGKRLQERFNLSKKLQVLDEVNKKIDADVDFGSNYVVIDNIDNLTQAWNEVVKICKKYDVEATIKNRKIYIADDVGEGGDDFVTDDDPIWFDENYLRYNKLREDNRAMGTKLDREADISSFLAGTVVYIKGKRTVLMATDIEDKEDGEYLIFVVYDRNTDKMSAPIRRKISTNKDGDDRISYGGWDIYIHDFEEVSETGALMGGYGVLDSKPVGNLDPPRGL